MTEGLNPSPLGCLRLWYSTMSLGDNRFSATFIMFFPVRRFALRMLLLDLSVQNTFSCEVQYKKKPRSKTNSLLNKLEFTFYAVIILYLGVHLRHPAMLAVCLALTVNIIIIIYEYILNIL